MVKREVVKAVKILEKLLRERGIKIYKIVILVLTQKEKRKKKATSI